MSEAFEAGKKASIAGEPLTANPYICGKTKLGALKFLDGGSDWESGWHSAKPARVASKAEIAAAQSVDVSRFRRKSNRHYSPRG